MIVKHGENTLKLTEEKYSFSLRKVVSARCKLTLLLNKVDPLPTFFKTLYKTDTWRRCQRCSSLRELTIQSVLKRCPLGKSRL